MTGAERSAGKRAGALGGMSFLEVLRRTWQESWKDAVFGQAGRMAFYHFLALFPALLVLLAGVDRVPGLAPHLKNALVDVGHQFLPQQAATLLQQMISELDGKVPVGWPLVSAIVGALWAALNATWALIYGLNIAYEVEECRVWWRLGLTVTALMLLLAAAGVVGFLSLFSAASMAHHIFGPPHTSLVATLALRSVQWLIVIILLMASVSTIYRFGPDLKQNGWKRSAPGGICALTLWIGITVGVRLYFQHINDYTRTYGHLNSVVMLLLWLYLTNGAILIGGEMNSEIEKAAGEREKGDGDKEPVPAQQTRELGVQEATGTGR